ncbi:MAG: L-serine ammonia-lyase [Burkholderiales bacterium]
MDISVFDLFKIGIGPSSSHTVGPMRAARIALEELPELARVSRVKVVLFGSLALTGRGHGTDKAVVLGLAGLRQDEVDPETVPDLLAAVALDEEIALLGRHRVPFSMHADIEFRGGETLPRHPNALRIEAHLADGSVRAATFYSIGGGFILRDGETEDRAAAARAPAPLAYASAAELLALGRTRRLRIPEVVRENERAWRSDADIDAGLDAIWHAMHACIERGLRIEGTLPGGLNVRRRAPGMRRQLAAGAAPMPHEVMDWISVYAIAVNEENAAGSRVVTAPTNGAAGIIPAVMRYYSDFCPGATQSGRREFLLAAAAVGALFKRNASISGAEVGCQGEVGAACAMAAAGLTAVLGGTNEQVENAAEIGIEHHLGMTCDPIGGLVQVPCIERNAMGAVKAINAASLALRGDGAHLVSLDQAIETVRSTGADMQHKYKETALGGLAINVLPVSRVEC